MELMSLLLELAEAPGTFGTLRKCDYPYNCAAERFKRVKDVVLMFNVNDKSMRIYILAPNAPFGMGGDNYSYNDISCREVTVLRSEIYQNTVQWKRATELLKQQWNDAMAVNFIANARAAMGQSVWQGGVPVVGLLGAWGPYGHYPGGNRCYRDPVVGEGYACVTTGEFAEWWVGTGNRSLRGPETEDAGKSACDKAILRLGLAYMNDDGTITFPPLPDGAL